MSRTGAEVEPGLNQPEQKRRRVTWGRRWASIEIPTVKQISFLCSIFLYQLLAVLTVILSSLDASRFAI